MRALDYSYEKHSRSNILISFFLCLFVVGILVSVDAFNDESTEQIAMFDDGNDDAENGI